MRAEPAEAVPGLLDEAELEEPVVDGSAVQDDPDPASVLTPGVVVVGVDVDVVSVLVVVVVEVVSVLWPEVVDDGVVLAGAVVPELVSELEAGQPVVAVPVAGVVVVAAGVVEPASTVESVWVLVRPASTVGAVLVFVTLVAAVAPCLVVVLAACLCVVAAAFFAAGLWR